MDSIRTILTLSDGSILEFPYQQSNNLPLMLTDTIRDMGCTTTIADTELSLPMATLCLWLTRLIKT